MKHISLRESKIEANPAEQLCLVEVAGHRPPRSEAEYEKNLLSETKVMDELAGFQNSRNEGFFVRVTSEICVKTQIWSGFRLEGVVYPCNHGYAMIGSI